MRVADFATRTTSSTVRRGFFRERVEDLRIRVLDEDEPVVAVRAGGVEQLLRPRHATHAVPVAHARIGGRRGRGREEGREERVRVALEVERRAVGERGDDGRLHLRLSAERAAKRHLRGRKSAGRSATGSLNPRCERFVRCSSRSSSSFSKSSVNAFGPVRAAFTAGV